MSQAFMSHFVVTPPSRKRQNIEYFDEILFLNLPNEDLRRELKEKDLIILEMSKKLQQMENLFQQKEKENSKLLEEKENRPKEQFFFPRKKAFFTTDKNQ